MFSAAAAVVIAATNLIQSDSTYSNYMYEWCRRNYIRIDGSQQNDTILQRSLCSVQWAVCVYICVSRRAKHWQVIIYKS